MIKVALIGCGRIADLHVPGYKANKQARIEAICDTSDEILQQRLKKDWRDYKIKKSYTDFNDVLKDKNIDAVEILTPQTLHEPMVIAALEAGKHVALQKPMTINLASADRMLAAAKKSNRIFKITENYIFYPPILEAKKLIDAGKIGDIYSVRIKFIGSAKGGWQVPAEAWEWRLKEAREGRGPVVFDHGHHLWSTAWFLGGEVESVSASIDSLDGAADCPTVVQWKYKDKKSYGIADLVQSMELPIKSKYYPCDEWVEVTGSKGIIMIHRNTGNLLPGPVMSIYNGKSWQSKNMASDWKLGFVGATHNFIGAIQGKEKPMWNGEDARHILRFSMAIALASHKRREVYLEELDRTFGWLYAWRRNRQRDTRPTLLQRIFKPGQKLSKYAPQARVLTLALLDRFDSEAAGNNSVKIALKLTADGGTSEQHFSLVVKNGKAQILEEQIDDAVLNVTTSAGCWAAVLLDKKRIEMAAVQGLIKAEGDVQEAFKLRAAFGM